MPYLDLHKLDLTTPQGRELVQYLGQDRAQALAKRVESTARAKNIDLLPQHQDAFLCLLLSFLHMNDEV